MSGHIEIPSMNFVMAKNGLTLVADLEVGMCVLTFDGTFSKIDELDFRMSDVQTVKIKCEHSNHLDIANATMPYLVYDRKTKQASYAMAKNLEFGQWILSAKPTMKYAKTRFSMDMNDFVTGFNGRKTVTLNDCAFSVRQIAELQTLSKSSVRVARMTLHGAYTAQTANGIVKTWGV